MNKDVFRIMLAERIESCCSWSTAKSAADIAIQFYRENGVPEKPEPRDWWVPEAALYQGGKVTKMVHIREVLE